MKRLKRNLAHKILRTVVPAILAAAALVAVLPGTAQPAFPGANGTIAFTREEGGGLWIRVVNPDGSGDTRLTETGSDSYPAPSPDGRKIAFSSFRNGDDEIYVMNADGSGQTRLTTAPGDDVDPAWSPDGQKLAFASSRDGNREIYVMNADGTGQTRLTSHISLDQDPSWSPDGAKIAFTSGRDGTYEIYVVNADGSGLGRLTAHDGRGDLEPEWSPDGRKIAFSSYLDYPAPRGIYVMNADGTGATRLTGTATAASYPAWSPDGKRIAFLDGDHQVSVMNADGSGATSVTTGPTTARELSWGPLATTHTATVQEPINADGSSVFKAGRGAVPVKFALATDGAPTCDLPPATIELTKLPGAAAGAVNESAATTASDSGPDFRIADCRYLYNLSLKSLASGTYRVTITLDGRAVGSATFELR